MKTPHDKRALLDSADKYLRDKFVYIPEAVETLQYPDYMLNGFEMSGRLVGDCDDISTLHATLLTVLGFQVRFVAIRSTFDDPNFDHVFVEAHDGGDWIPYDLTIPLGTRMEMFGRVAIPV